MRPRNDADPQEGAPAANGEDSDLLQSIIDATDVAIRVVDRRGRILLSNRAWADLLGIGETAAKPREWQAECGRSNSELGHGSTFYFTLPGCEE